MGWLLAIETSAVRGSVALLRDGRVVGERVLHVPRQHNELLLGEVSALLAAADIDSGALAALAFGYGPGSFTGVRLAAAAAQAFAWVHEIPVFAVDCGEALAQAAWRSSALQLVRAGVMGGPSAARSVQEVRADERVLACVHANVLVALDARMGQLYWLALSAEQRHPVRGWQVVSWSHIESECRLPERYIGIGDEWSDARFPAAIRAGALLVCEDAVPQATDVGVLAWQRWCDGERPSAEQAQPLYLRGADAWG